MKAKIISRYSVKVIDYDIEKQKADNLYKATLQEKEIGDEFIKPILAKKEEKRTESDLIKIILRKELEDNYKNKLDELSVFKEYVPSEFFGEIDDTDSVRPYYIEEGESVLQKWEVVKKDVGKINEKIKSLKEKLSEGDYKVIKIYEAKLANKDEPYSQTDEEEFIKERQSIRDEINRLESLLPNSGTIREMKQK